MKAQGQEPCLEEQQGNCDWGRVSKRSGAVRSDEVRALQLISKSFIFILNKMDITRLEQRNNKI